MNKNLSFLVDKPAQNIALKGVEFFEKLPHLPDSWVKFLAKILPYLVLIAGISSILGGLQNFFSFTPLHRWSMGLIKINRSFFYVSGVFELLTGALYLLSYDALKKRQYEGWMILFWLTALGVLRSIVMLFFGWNSVFGLLLSALIGFWLTYEMRSEYVAKTVAKVANKAAKKKAASKKKS